MDSASTFNTYLKQGEVILWKGKPKSGLQLRDTDIILIPMSIILIGFAVMLDYILMHYQSPLVFKALGVLLAILGIYFGGVRFFLDRLKRRRIFYCITTKRILVISGRKKKLKTLPLKNIERLDLTEEKDGSGFIIFGNTNPLWPWLLGGFYGSANEVPGLELLPDVMTVYRILEQQIRVEMPPALMERIKAEKKEELN